MELIIKEYIELIKNGPTYFSKMANTTAFIKTKFPSISWVGFYLYDRDKEGLVLGPFQGHVACDFISWGKGVVGTCVKECKIQNIKNVSKISNYISCSNNTKSELCIPLINGSFINGVLDIDFDQLNTLNDEDIAILEQITYILVQSEYDTF